MVQKRLSHKQVSLLSLMGVYFISAGSASIIFSLESVFISVSYTHLVPPPLLRQGHGVSLHCGESAAGGYGLYRVAETSIISS